MELCDKIIYREAEERSLHAQLITSFANIKYTFCNKKTMFPGVISKINATLHILKKNQQLHNFLCIELMYSVHYLVE